MTRAQLVERLWSRVERRGPRECWLWRGPTNKATAPIFTVRQGDNRRQYRARRLAYETAHDTALGDWEMVRVACGEKLCLNPSHLVVRSRQDNAELFWSRVDRTGGNDACWIWTGARRTRGYGAVCIGSRRHGTSRHVMATHFALALVGINVPRGMFVCHRCDNPPCVNPAHLFVGTNADNMADMAAKGRANRGARCRTAKLSDSDVVAIRELCSRGASQAEVARAHGVSFSLIGMIVRRERWRHVP